VFEVGSGLGAGMFSSGMLGSVRKTGIGPTTLHHAHQASRMGGSSSSLPQYKGMGSSDMAPFNGFREEGRGSGGDDRNPHLGSLVVKNERGLREEVSAAEHDTRHL
jgi:hypothetical protein